MKVLLATTNKAKIKYYGTKLKEQGIEVLSIEDLNLGLDVEESGKSPNENAILKAKAYYEVSKIPTIAIDEGLFFESVPDEIQPGVNVRRVNGKRLSDTEMIEYYKGLVKQFGTLGQLNGYFLKSVAIVYGEETFTFDYKANRIFSSTSSKTIDEGYPLESIQIIPNLNKFKSELDDNERIEMMNQEQIELFDYILKVVTGIEHNQSKNLVKS
ncbi:MAG: hypothetical protein HFH08_07105 [Bacilli bacterium]|nr:hypothetical protein [Bacilli bacterium]